MRAQVLTLRDREFVQAARALGARYGRIMWRHMVPNGLDPVMANVTLQMAYAALTEASLAFLGLGDPNRPSWGRIIAEGQQYILGAWWMIVFPGAALSVLLLSLHLVGDGFASAMNPKASRRAR